MRPNPATVPVTTGPITDVRRHSSRAAVFDRCSSTFTPSYAASASAIAYDVCVNAPGLMTIAARGPRALDRLDQLALVVRLHVLEVVARRPRPRPRASATQSASVSVP